MVIVSNFIISSNHGNKTFIPFYYNMNYHQGKANYYKNGNIKISFVTIHGGFRKCPPSYCKHDEPEYFQKSAVNSNFSFYDTG